MLPGLHLMHPSRKTSLLLDAKKKKHSSELKFLNG